MKRPISLALIGALILAGFLTVAQTRSSSQRGDNKQLTRDTLQPKQNRKAKDFDEAMVELDKAMQQLDMELKKPLPPLPPIELEKMKAELQEALKEVDPEKIKAEVEATMKQIDVQKLRADVQASLAKVDMEKVRKEIERLNEVELPKLEKEMQKLGPEIEKSMKEAKVSIEKAKKELQEYQAFESNLVKDGLINKEKYTVEHKNGVFTINGKVQSAEVYNKYKSFLEKHKSITIKKDDDNLNINTDND
jgi:hypothetical protein